MEVVLIRTVYIIVDVQWDGRDFIVWMVSFIIDKIYIKFYFNLFLYILILQNLCICFFKYLENF